MYQENVQEAIRIARLIYDKNRGVLSDAEEAALNHWRLATPENGQLFTELNSNPDQEEIIRKLSHYNARAALDKTLKQICKSEDRKGKPKRKLLMYASAAAVLLITAAIALYFQDETENGKPQTARITAAEIQPGYNQATLTLANGTKVALDSNQIGIITNDDDIKYNDGTKVEAPIHRSSFITYNSLTTPKGGQYQVILEDGTKVWLNAASTLRYPSRFSEDRREVEIEGEAYFQIAKKGNAKSQFVVRSRDQVTTVLGTSFNINSYETTVKTTLASGKVRITGLVGKPVILGSPNEQSQLAKNGVLTKTNANIEIETAWKSGLFYFENTPFAEVMQQISRWYDIDIIYKGKIPQKTFSGEMTREVSLGSVLKFVKGSGIQFEMEGRKLIIE